MPSRFLSVSDCLREPEKPELQASEGEIIVLWHKNLRQVSKTGTSESEIKLSISAASEVSQTLFGEIQAARGVSQTDHGAFRESKARLICLAVRARNKVFEGNCVGTEAMECRV
jgi:hypothetical protein